jgi:putative NADH-flavin reductase
MRLLIVGATGGTGKQLTEQTLSQDHDVTGLARHAERMGTRHRRLRMVPGDVLNAASLDAAAAGQDAVLWALGTAVTRKPVTVFSEGTRNLLRAMERHGVRRLLCITGIGTGDSRGHGGLIYDRIVQPLLLKTIYEDKDRQEELIRRSDREWIIIRPGFLTNGPATGNYHAFTDLTGVTAGKISRADVRRTVLLTY